MPELSHSIFWECVGRGSFLEKFVILGPLRCILEAFWDTQAVFLFKSIGVSCTKVEGCCPLLETTTPLALLLLLPWFLHFDFCLLLTGYSILLKNSAQFKFTCSSSFLSSYVLLIHTYPPLNYQCTSKPFIHIWRVLSDAFSVWVLLFPFPWNSLQKLDPHLELVTGLGCIELHTHHP